MWYWKHIGFVHESGSLLLPVVVLTALVGYGFAWKHLNPLYTDLAKFFLGAYPESARTAWLTTAIILLLAFLAGMYDCVRVFVGGEGGGGVAGQT